MSAVSVLVGSLNPVKCDAVGEAFGHYFDEVVVEGISVASGVPEQPVGEQTLVGSRNRARRLRELAAAREAAYCVGIEGGIMQLGDRWFALGSMCVIDANGREAFGTSPLFELPGRVIEELRAGRELGAVIDALSGEPDSKRKGGAIGYFTRGVMDRRALYVAGLVVALVPLINARAYYGESNDGA